MIMQTFKGPYDEARPHRAGYREISVEAAFRARGRAHLVDVREASELAATGHIPGAEHVPLGALDAHAVGWSTDRDIILVCRSGARSARAAEALLRRGFRRVMSMTGGMSAYTAAGLPVADS